MISKRVLLTVCVLVPMLPGVGRATTRRIAAPFDVQAIHATNQPILRGTGEATADATATPDGVGRTSADATASIGGTTPVSGPVGAGLVFIDAHDVLPDGVKSASYTAHVHISYMSAAGPQPIAFHSGNASATTFLSVGADCSCESSSTNPMFMRDADPRQPLIDRSVDMVGTIATTDGSDLPSSIQIRLTIESQASAGFLPGDWGARADIELLSIDVTV